MSNKQIYHSPSNKSNFESIATKLKVPTLSASNTHHSRKHSTNSQPNFSGKHKSSQFHPQTKKSSTNQNANKHQIPEIRINSGKIPNQSRRSKPNIKHGLNQDYEGFIEEPYAREKAAAKAARKSVDNSALFRKKLPNRSNTKMKSTTNNDYHRFSQKPPSREQSIRSHKTPESNHSFHNRQGAFSPHPQHPRSPSILKHKRNSDSFTHSTNNGKDECECSPSFYSSFLGPTADEVILNGLKALRMLYDSVVSCRRGVEMNSSSTNHSINFDEPEIIKQLSSRGASFLTEKELSEALIQMDVEPEEAAKIASKHFSSLHVLSESVSKEQEIGENRAQSSKQLTPEETYKSLVDNANSVQRIESFPERDPTVQSFLSKKSSKSKSMVLEDPEYEEETEEEREEEEEEEEEREEEKEAEEEEKEEEVEEEVEEEREEEEEEEEREREKSYHSVSNRSSSVNSGSRRSSSRPSSHRSSISVARPSQHHSIAPSKSTLQSISQESQISAKSNHSEQSSTSSCENISEKVPSVTMSNKSVGSDSIGFSLISREMSDKGEQVTISASSARSLLEPQTIIKSCKCCKCGVRESINIPIISGDADNEKKGCCNTNCKNMRSVSTITLPRLRNYSTSNESTICRKFRRMCKGFSG